MKQRSILATATAVGLGVAACGAAVATVGSDERIGTDAVENTFEHVATADHEADLDADLDELADHRLDVDAAGDDPRHDVDSRTSDGQWYRDIRMSRWTWLGADEASITDTLDRIASADGDRTDPDLLDTIDTFGPGHWTYEFATAADAAAARGDHREASALSLIASYPHNDPDGAGGAALAASIHQYELAAIADGHHVERISLVVDGADVTALLHLPPVATTAGPAPVMMITGGIDVVLTEHYPYFRDHLAPAGVATITFDIPGNGGSSDLVLDPDMDRVHVAVLDAIAADDRLDPDRVAAMSMSGGGPAGVELAIDHGDRLVAAVNRCGVVASALGLPAEVYAAFPAMTIDTYAVRAGLEPGDLEGLALATGEIDLVERGLLGTGRPMTDVPILSVNTADDDVAPLEDMELVTAASTHGELVVVGEEGHCAPDQSDADLIMDWVLDHL